MKRRKIERSVLVELRRIYPRASRSWLKRSLKRASSVVRKSENLWIVHGMKSMGDYYDVYYVRRKGKKYVCSCQEPPRKFHNVRSRGYCTHIGAVLAFQLVEKLSAARKKRG